MRRIDQPQKHAYHPGQSFGVMLGNSTRDISRILAEVSSGVDPEISKIWVWSPCSVSIQSKLNFVERSCSPTTSGIVESVCPDVKVPYT